MDCGPDICAIGIFTTDEPAKHAGPNVGIPYAANDVLPTKYTNIKHVHK